MTADSTVAEIEASGGAALGIEVGVRNHEAIEAYWRAPSRSGAASMYWSRTQAKVVVGPFDTPASSLVPALLIVSSGARLH
jgi:hypothetical protein